MATPSPSFTPRLRMTRHSPIHYDQSQVASTSESGPSRLPDFSQLVDVNLDDMASDTTEQPTQSRISTTSTATRSDNPAAVLRALLSRLPNQSSSPRPQSPQQYPSERESDYEDQESIDATPASRSQAQESLRDIFSKARRDPDTPRKGLQRRNSLDPNEAGGNSEANSDRSIQKGKQRSFSDDEFEQNSKTPLPNKAGKRSKTSPQPITKEFLRERFSNSYASPNGAPNEDSLQHAYDPSNESFLRELNSSEAIPTSTPQHSLRMSVNSQFHTNLLESDTEMQHAIEGLDSYGDESRERSLSPPPTIRRGPKTSTTQVNSSSSGPNQDLDRTPLQSNTRHNNIRQESDSLPGTSYKVEHSTRPKSHNVTNDYLDPHSHRTTSLSSMDLTSPLGGAEVFHHRSKNSSMLMLNDLHDESVGNRGPERSNLDIGASSSRSLNDYRHHSQRFEQQEASSPQRHSPSGSSLDLPNGSVAKQKNSQDSNLDSPHPSRLSRFGLRSSPRPYSPTSRSHDRHHEAADEGDFVEHMPSHPSYTRQELSSTSGRTSSLQAIDNTYLQRDSQQSGRSSTPLQSISKKRPASPSTSTNSRKLKASPSLTFNGEGTGFPFSAKETPSRFMSRSPEEEPTRGFSSTPRSDQNLSKSRAELSRRTEDEQASETDELRDTDFSSRGGTPPIPLAQPDNYVEVSGSSSVDISQFPMPPSTPRTTSQDRTSFRQTSPERPSTPPQRPASRNTRREFRTPSPPQALPDLPTPSSSDESEDIPSRMQTTTPRSDPSTRQDLTSLQTPRPPGGWAKTPKPKPKPKSATGSDLSDDGRYLDDNELHYPKTPSNLHNYPNGHTLDTIGKTPRPPGGWLATPAPVPGPPASQQELSSQNAGLLTPMTSLSKGAGFDPKTPGVPGGWLTTPAARKSILKVRFDPREQTSQLSGQTTTETMDEVHDQTRQSTVSSPRNKSIPLPPSPRSPRKGKTAIRVVDAFGRKQTDPEADDKASRSMLRVVDALGREVQQNETSHSKDTTFDQEFKHSSRSELLAHIRQGLDNLATEFDDETMHDDLSASEVRIEELSRTSQDARLARKQLQAQSTSRPLVDLNSKQKLVQSGIWANRRRFWLTLLLIQLVLLVLMFRISSHWAKQRYLTSFYDPFNPELYLYGSNFDYYSYVMEDAFSRTSWFSYARHRFSSSAGFWRDCLRFSCDIRSYLWNILTTEPPPRNGSAWLPT